MSTYIKTLKEGNDQVLPRTRTEAIKHGNEDLNTIIDTIEGVIPSTASSSNRLTDKAYVDGEIEDITDLIPSDASSTNKLTSHNYVYNDLYKSNNNSIVAIEKKISPQASEYNKLTDRDFVNSSIATETAHYISNNGQPFTSVQALESYTGTITNNDYAFVTGTDSVGNTYYDRYKATRLGGSEETVEWDGNFSGLATGTAVSGGTTTTYYKVSSYTSPSYTTLDNAFIGATIKISNSGGVIKTMRVGRASFFSSATFFLGISNSGYEVIITTGSVNDLVYAGITYNFPSDGIWYPDEGHSGTQLNEYLSYIHYGGERFDWGKEYRLNNSSFTAAQWAAISSGITQGKVESYDGHLNRKDNPHEVTKAQILLGNVDNTSDLNKPISTATQNALDTKQATLVSGTNIKTINSSSILSSGNLNVGNITYDDSEVGSSLPMPHLYWHSIQLRIDKLTSPIMTVWGTCVILSTQSEAYTRDTFISFLASNPDAKILFTESNCVIGSGETLYQSLYFQYYNNPTPGATYVIKVSYIARDVVSIKEGIGQISDDTTYFPFVDRVNQIF